jgi:predicted RNase H-like HicB family nuclease
MLSVYPAIFYENKTSVYSVVFPDLNHLASCGDNLNDAMSMAIDCLAGYLYDEKLDNKKFPVATSVKDINIHCEEDDDDNYISSFVNMVSVDVEEYAKLHFNKAVKKTLTIPKWLNDMALNKNINFSKILQNALMEE